MLKFCSFTPLYNENGQHLRRNLESQEKLGIKRAYFPDGAWHPSIDFNAHEDGLSYDGTRDIIKEFKFTKILDCGWWGEIRSVNHAFRTAAKEGFKWVLQLSSDEWLTGDMGRFSDNCEDSLDENKNGFCLKFITHHITPPSQVFDRLMRCFYDPGFIRLRHIHWWYYYMNKQLELGSMIRGLELHHDDIPRSLIRENSMTRFQKWQAKHDRQLLIKLKTPKIPENRITKYPCGCEDGIIYFIDKFEPRMRGHKIRCPSHSLILQAKD